MDLVSKIKEQELLAKEIFLGFSVVNNTDSLTCIRESCVYKKLALYETYKFLWVNI